MERADRGRARDDRPRLRAAVLTGVGPRASRVPRAGRGPRALRPAGLDPLGTPWRLRVRLRGWGRQRGTPWDTRLDLALSQGASTCPSPPPRSTPRCSTAPRPARFAYPAINVHVVADAERRAAGLRRGRQRRHHPGLHRRRGVPLRPDGQGHGHRRGRRSPSSRTWSPRSTRSTSRCTPTTARRTSSTATSGRCSRSRRSGSTRGEDAAVPVAHVGRLGRAAGREPGDRRRSCSPSAAAANIILEIEIGVVGGEEDGVVGEINEKLYTTPEDALATVEALGLGENGRYLTGRDLRQRARRLQAGQRQAAPGDPQGGPGRRRPRSSAWPTAQAVRPRLPRRLRLAARGDRARPSTTAWSR